MRRSDEALTNSDFYAALNGFADFLEVNPEAREALRRAESAESFAARLRCLGNEAGYRIDESLLDAHLRLLLIVDDCLFFLRPDVRIRLGELPLHVRVRVATGWMLSRLRAVVDTPPPYKPRRAWLRDLLRRPADPRPHPAPEKQLHYSEPERRRMRALYQALGNETWRLHIDWEHQELGPDVFALGKHARGRGRQDKNFLPALTDAWSYAGDTVGQRMDADEYERYQHLCFAYLDDDKPIRYDGEIKEWWRLKDWVEPGVLADIDWAYVRELKHRYYEALAVRWHYDNDEEKFRQRNPEIAAVLLRKLGHLRLTPRILDREFLRFQVFYADRPVDAGVIKDALGQAFDEFYTRMTALSYELTGAEGRRFADLRDRQLLEIARLHKRIHYMRPFRDGNTRVSLVVVNKLLIDFGFVPSIVAHRNDAPFYTDRGWHRILREGMQRWQVVRLLHRMDLLDHVLSLRRAEHRRGAHPLNYDAVNGAPHGIEVPKPVLAGPGRRSLSHDSRLSRLAP